MFVDHEKHALCDSYIVEFVHDATESYYERGKHGSKHFNIITFPLFKFKVLKLLLFYLPMLVTLFFMNLFVYKIPMHRKWVRLKCVSYFFDALFCISNLIPMWELGSVICCPENRFLSFTAKNVKNHRKGILSWDSTTAIFSY